MHKNLRSVLLASTALSFLLVAPAHAADSTASAIKSLQAQVNALQKQLTSMQANEQAATAAPVVTEAKKEILPGVSVKMGGFVAMEGVYRDRSQAGDMATNFSGVTLGHTADSSHGEFRGSARQTRLSMLAEGKVNPDMTLGAYLEGDFMGAGGTYTKTNSWSPRLRQGFVTVDRNDLGLHVLAGQAWSLATSSKAGISPRGEDLPMVIDGSLLPGVVYTRGPQFRVVKDLADNKVHLALSAESPSVMAQGAVNVAGTTSMPDGDVPDIIAKAAYDNSLGHFEAFGLTRFFTATHTGATTFNNDREVGYGGGVSAFVPIIAKKLELHANMMAGKGVGRYTVVSMPDYIYNSNGDIKPVAQMVGMVGLIGHPTTTLDAYLYVGAEKAMREGASGYGVGELTTAACYTGTAACTNALTETVWTVTPGLWDTVYTGDYGNLKVGAQYSLTRRDAFTDVNNKAPHAFENVGMLSFRYSPF